MSKQHRDSQKGGGQIVGKAPNARAYMVPKFLGKSGTPDNQSTSRKQT